MVRVHRILPLFALLAWLGFMVTVAGDAMAQRGGAFPSSARAAAVAAWGESGAQAEAGARSALVSRSVAVEPYRPGPLDQRGPASAIDWPQGSRELLALGMISAILYGFRASGLAQQSSRRHGAAVDPGEGRVLRG